jgi:LPXTG-motif cell wall-anchored protein
MLKVLASACVFAVLAFTSTTTHAQSFDNRTFFTFSGPVTLPGVTLPAGKYLFRNPDTLGGRRVVQVLSQDGKQAYAQLLTIPVQRFDVPAEPEIRFMETAEGTPAAIKAWWYPGRTIGWEFVYPKEQALRLAKRAEAPVLTTVNVQNDTTEEMKTADLARVTTSGSETAVTIEEKPAATTVVGTSQQGETAASSIQVAASPTPVSVQANASTGASPRTRLPQTASSAPIAALVGALSIMSAAALRAVRRRSRKDIR